VIYGFYNRALIGYCFIKLYISTLLLNLQRYIAEELDCTANADVSIAHLDFEN